MAKAISSFELTLRERDPHQTITQWLYTELRGAILEGRLRPGTRLPASRDFARLQRLSRGTVVNVFERLQSEGFLASSVGSGTWVNHRVSPPAPVRKDSTVLPRYARSVISSYKRPKPLEGWLQPPGGRPFRMRDPAIEDFPSELWGRLAARRARQFKSWLKTYDDGLGYQPLRDALADYLGSCRGVRCTADQIVIVSGVQQGLDLLARVLLKPGDPIWMEDPGYFGGSIVFANRGAKIVPVPVDDEGLSLSAAVKSCPRPAGMYLTPAHQFPMGMTMSLERRMAIVAWAARTGAFIIEDDYDSEYRFEGKPVPALQSLDSGSNVILIGSFTKLLFPSIRLGYVVLPQPLVGYFQAYRYHVDFRSINFDQAVLCDFITEGHLGRHLRRMRELYATRLGALMEAGQEYLDGALEISSVKAGLYTAGFLRNGMSSRAAEEAATANGIEVLALDRFTLKRRDPKGVLLGFAAFDEATIRQGVTRLAAAWKA